MHNDITESVSGALEGCRSSADTQGQQTDDLAYGGQSRECCARDWAPLPVDTGCACTVEGELRMERLEQNSEREMDVDLKRKEAYPRQRTVLDVLAYVNRYESSINYNTDVKKIALESPSPQMAALTEHKLQVRFKKMLKAHEALNPHLPFLKMAALAEILLYVLTEKFSNGVWTAQLRSQIEAIEREKIAFDKVLSDFSDTCLPGGRSVENDIRVLTTRAASNLMEKKMCEPLAAVDAPIALKFELASILFLKKKRNIDKLLQAAVEPIVVNEAETVAPHTGWYGYAVSCRGWTHKERKNPCDDDCGLREYPDRGILIGYAADGVGSQPDSHVGSKMAGEAFFELMDRLLAKGVGTDESLIEMLLSDFERQLALRWKEKLAQYALWKRQASPQTAEDSGADTANQRESLSRFATTFHCFVRTPKYFFCYKIGDGEVFVYDGFSVNSVIEINDNNTHDHYAATLCNVGGERKLSALRVLRSEHVKSVLMTSDGAEFIAHRLINGLRYGRSAGAAASFLAQLGELPRDKKRETILRQAKLFADGVSFCGAKQDDTTMTYAEFE